MSDGMGRELAYLSSHATNRYFIPNWGKDLEIYFATEDPENETYVTNDADGKHFHDLPDDHFIAPLDY